MCTLSYIPKTENTFLLTSNRDESITRKPALEPTTYTHNDILITYPKDTQAGGTWLAVSENQFTLCLLNGAFKKHVPNPPYIRSRGLVIPDFFTFNDVRQFVQFYNFDGIEPFTFIIIESKSVLFIHEIRWDGAEVFYSTKDYTQPHIWSSVTLYTSDVILEREKWFEIFLTQKPNPGLTDMLHFHHFGGDTDEQNNILMNRDNKLRTISITCIENRHTEAVMHYEDLLTTNIKSIHVPMNSTKNFKNEHP